MQSLETKLINQINTPFDANNMARLIYLDSELGNLTPKEADELLQLAEIYEDYYVERVKHLSQLATFKSVSIETLMLQLDIKTPVI